MRLGLTQRTYVTAQGEKRDCLDQNWYSFFTKLGHMPILLPGAIEDVAQYSFELNIDAFVLTGGNDIEGVGVNNVDAKRDGLELQICKHSVLNSIKVLGICRGFQLINLFLGGKINVIDGHAGKDHHVYDLKGKSRNVNSFHNFGIMKQNLSDKLKPIFFDNEYHIEAAVSEIFMGIMWHPERENNGSIEREIQEFLNHG
jgi:N5-(cytidine 5'-diphosphoramidyl)-L-glutamine hydrolase